MEGMSQEYMAAVAVSLQKTKELEEAQHQAAIQKTLT
jgi:predicted Holliday junction resolvase-like endonuclease